MSEQPIYPGARPTIGAQLPEIQALTVLATTAGHLPPLHVDLSMFKPAQLGLSFEALPDFEVWRTHLEVPPALVQLHAYSTSSWLSMDVRIGDVEIEFVCHLELSREAAVLTPQEDASRREQAALLVQRHELEDAAVPPLGAAGPQPSALELGRAEAEAWNAAHPVGTRVAAFPLTREDEPLLTKTRSKAWPLGHGDLVVLVEGYSGGICLSHVDVLPDTVPPAEPIAVRPLADMPGAAL